ncbi:efflux RND transporter permease subunit [Pseudothermotoga thermarum]|nr:MMPL family transporter [Pseudothermotoga thermarum]
MRYKYTLITLALFAICAFVVVSKIKIDSSYLVFLPGYKYGQSFEKVKSEYVKALVEVSEKFSDGAQLLVVLYSKDTFFDEKKILKLSELQNKLLSLEGVKSILSVLNYPFKKPYFDGQSLSKEILFDEESKNFISSDGKYVVLSCVLKANKDLKFNPQVIREIKKVLSDYGEFSPLLFGESVINYHLFQEILRQSSIYPTIMFFVIFIIFYFQTRSFVASLIALCYPVISIVVVLAVALSFGMVLNVMTVMSVSFLIIIGSAYGLHFYNGVLRFKKDVRKHMFRPIFYSMVTTAIGFLSFLFVKIQAFRELGMLVSSGLAVDFILLFTSGYELLSKTAQEIVKPPIFLKISSRKIGMAIFVLVLLAAISSPLLLKNILVGMDQVMYFDKKSEIRRATEILRNYFSYREPIYVMLEKSSPFNLKDGETVLEIIDKLNKLNGVSSVQFPTSFSLPSLIIARRFQPAVSFFVADNRTIRLVVNMTPEGYTKSLQLKSEIEKILKDYEYSYTLASVAFVVEEINSQIVKNQLETLFVSLIFIFVAVLAAFRKFVLSWTILVPIFATALMNFAFMSLLKVRLEISTSMVASILIGLVVDYSIHLAHDLRMTEDIDQTIRNIALPIFTNALGLIAGFTVLFFSKLALFRNVSVLLCLGIAFGCLFTIFSQPMILQKVLIMKKQS